MKYIKIENGIVIIVYVKLDDDFVGLKLINLDILVKYFKVVLIKCIEVFICIYLNKLNLFVIKRI